MIGSIAGFAGAGEGGDDAGLGGDFADHVVADVADVEIASGVELDAVRLVELGGVGGAGVAGVAGFTGADDRGDEAGGEDSSGRGCGALFACKFINQNLDDLKLLEIFK